MLAATDEKALGMLLATSVEKIGGPDESPLSNPWLNWSSVAASSARYLILTAPGPR